MEKSDRHELSTKKKQITNSHTLWAMHTNALLPNKTNEINVQSEYSDFWVSTARNENISA